MSVIPRRHDILDGVALAAALQEVVGLPDRDRRVVGVLKAALARGRVEIRHRFDEEGRGATVLRNTSYLVDQLVRALHDFATNTVFPLGNPSSGEALAIVAVGGYGRGELAPFSDIDLLFLLPYKRLPYIEQVVEYLLYALWDLGLKVGQATRPLDDCIRQAKADMTIRTGLLEARFLCGDRKLYTALDERFEKEVVQGTEAEFVDAKMEEREARHRQTGDSRYVLEPNIKEGKGALRDLHSLFWMAKYTYHVDQVSELIVRGVIDGTELKRFDRAQNFLWTVRCHLHYLAGRAEERLTFDVQTEIGRRMGYTDHTGSRGVERFMKHYFLVAKDVGDLTRIFVAIIEDEQKRKTPSRWRRWFTSRKVIEGFPVEGGRLSVPSPRTFVEDPVALLRLFAVAERHGVEIHPQALRLVTRSLKLIDGPLRNDPEANRLFLEMATSTRSPETALRRLNEAGVLGRFLPDFGRVVAQMQYDMYHVYTVDEHLLFAVGMVHKLETGELADEAPLATELMRSVGSRRALYVAVLLHDIAKGRGGDHSILGEQVVLRVAPRLGLTEEETETCAWLVRNHLLLSNVSFTRDLEDPKTISDVVSIVQSPERLKLLQVLTVADIRAVGPRVWNGWKAALLRDLYGRASAHLSGEVAEERRNTRLIGIQAATRALLADESDEVFAAFAARASSSFWLSGDAPTLARRFHLMHDAARNGVAMTVETRADPARAVTEVVVYTADHPGLFTRIAGALSLARANIVDARIVTMTDGMALDTFWIQDQDGGAVDDPDRLVRLRSLLDRVMAGSIKPHVELSRPAAYVSRTQVFTVAPRVLIDNTASSYYTVIEVNGRDRPALLFDLTQALTRLNLQISSAKISTWGERVVDVFYVKDLFGLKVDREEKLARIRETLRRIMSDNKTGRTSSKSVPAPAMRDAT